jgi:hypothetical protein
MYSIRNPKFWVYEPFILIELALSVPAFGFAWSILNADYIPRIGVGANGFFASCAGGLAFAYWCSLQLEPSHALSPRKSFLTEQLNCFILPFVGSAIGIPLGRIVFSILPPWHNSWGSVIGAFSGLVLVQIFVGEKKGGRFKHNRGTVLLSFDEAVKRIQGLPEGPEPRIKWAGFDLPGEIAEGNLLATGAIGTGKTRMHRELLRSVIPSIIAGSDRRALVYDVKCDLLSELHSMRPASPVLVFNPFDRRSVAWDIAADVCGPEQSSDFAEALILPGKNDTEFFSAAARSIVAGVIDSLNARHPGKWTLRRLILVMSTQDRLERVLKGSDLIDEFFQPADTFSNIKNTIANATRKLRVVAALWEHTADKISLKSWVENGDSILVLAGKENLQASLEPLNRVAFKMISSEFLSQRESPVYSRLWFFCDELKTAGRLDSLPALMNARSKGVRCVLGCQDIEGLIQAYNSHETPKEILNRCKTVTWLRLTSNDTADWASKRTSDMERYEYMGSKTAGKNETSVSEQLTKREAVMAAEFLNLPDYVNGNVCGYHMIKGLGGIFQSTAHYQFNSSDVADFDPRPTSEQLLKPWGPDDDAWLDGKISGEPAGSDESEDPESDTGTIGRIDFD